MKYVCKICMYLHMYVHVAHVHNRQPDDMTLSVVVEAFRERGKDRMFASYVDSIARRIKKNPCGQNG